MFKKIYAVPILISIILLIATISAYTIKLPACNDGIINTSCVTLSDATGTTNTGNPAVVFYQNGNIYVSNDIPTNYTINYYNYTNITNVNLTNMTNITYVTYNINLSNGSTYVIQENQTIINYSIDNDYLRQLFQQVYLNSNFSNFYNTSYINANFETISDVNNIKNTLSNYVSRADLSILDARINALNNNGSNNINGLNMTRLKDIVDNGTDFSTIWKVVIIIEAVIIVLLLLFVGRSMMSSG